MKYAPLWCKSNYSFLEGASYPDELIEEAHGLGLSVCALTDRDGVYGAVQAHLKARELGVKLIVGSEISVEDGTSIVLLAQHRQGYASLCRLISTGRLRCPKGRSKVSWDEVCSHSHGLLALWGGAKGGPALPDEPRAAAEKLKEAFSDRLYAMLSRHLDAEETPGERRLILRARQYGLPLVAANEVLYHTRARRPLCDVLSCIRNRVTLSKAGRAIRGSDEYFLRPPALFPALFADLKGAVELTNEVADQCNFSLADISYRYPSECLDDGTTSAGRLRLLTMEGAQARYGKEIPKNVLVQLDKELALIEELDYPGYFLTMWEIVRFCREQNILCQGRGSAANSAVCYCLDITAVDPVLMDLLFERFISRERAEPPDIDLDIEHERREEVIQHVYAKYGRNRAAMVAVVIRYRPKSAVRDVGAVMKIPAPDIDRLARLLSRYNGLEEHVFTKAGFSMDIPAHMHLFNMVQEILDFPRHLSIHPGGFLLGSEPIDTLVPIENGTMENRTVIQWDKDDVEALGLFKVDLLGLGALNHLHRGFDLLKKHQGIDVSMASIPPDDKPTFDMVTRGETVGVFQIESRAQMSMLPRLRPRTFYDLVVEVSIVRPGPITGGMVHPYLRRRNGEEEVTYPHPCLEPVLKKTLGIPLFQEQVIKLAMVAADYTPGEADQLRRDMAAWRRSGRIERHRERLISRMAKKGIDVEFAKRVFDQIRGFGEYGFPESHAASFALISYATAWMRCHYPAEFICSLLNAQPMGFYTPSTIVEEAGRLGVSTRQVCAKASDWDCTLEADSSDAGFAVRMGMRFVKGMGAAQFERVAAARKDAPFDSLADFVKRTRLDKGILTRLAETGAFESFGKTRRDALWDVPALCRTCKDELNIGPASLKALGFDDLSRFETIAWDYLSAGHSTRGHPLEPLRRELSKMGLPTAEKLLRLKHGAFARYAGMVICRQRPSTAAGVTFMTLEDETGFVNAVIWKDVFKRFEIIGKIASILGISGKIQNQDGVTHLIAKELWIPSLTFAPSSSQSRDFR